MRHLGFKIYLFGKILEEPGIFLKTVQCGWPKVPSFTKQKKEEEEE